MMNTYDLAWIWCLIDVYMYWWLSEYQAEEAQIIYGAFLDNTFVIVLNNTYFPCNSPHRPQQPLLLHGYKESELQISPLGPRALPIPFSNRLPPGQSKCSCRCFVEVSAKKPGWGGWAPSWEWPNPSLFAEFTDQCQLSRAQSSILFPITLAPSSHLWDLCLTSAPPFLGWPTKRASLWRSLQGQHRRHEIETTGTAEWGQTGAET